MYVYYYSPLGIAALFVCVGVILYKRQRRNGKATQLISVEVFVPILAILAGVSLLLGLIFFSPSPSRRQALIDGALHSSVSDIAEIDFKAYPATGNPSFFFTPIAIRDRADIAQIANALNHATSFNPNHPVKKWSVWMTIKTKTSQFDFMVLRSSDSENGTIIELSSGVTDGWMIGMFRSDTLGAILEACDQKSRRDSTTPTGNQPS